MPASHRAIGVALAATLLLFSGFYSHAAPNGHWRNIVFGSDMWFESDPGGDYVASAHELLGSNRGPLYPGHPGTPLQLLLAGVQHGYHLAAADGSETYTRFTARNLPRVFFFSKLLITLLHLLSFYLVYRLARLLLQSDRAALIAALAYASSFPVLYYLSRISVEPLLVSFFVATFLALAASLRRHGSGDAAGANLAAGLAGVFAASGFFTKLNLLGPLPFFAPAYLLARGETDSFLHQNFRERIPLALSCGASSILAGLVYTQWVDWGDFVDLWRHASETENLFQHGSLSALLPSVRSEGLFLLTEFFFVVVGGFGWTRLLMRPAQARTDAVWLTLYAPWVLLIWVYRVATLGNLRPFHYLMLIMVLSAVGFGLVTEELLKRVAPQISRRKRAAVLATWILLFHHVAIWAVVDSRRRDVERHRPLQLVQRILPELAPGQRIGLLSPPESTPVVHIALLVSGLGVRYAPEVRRSRLQAEYRSFFTHVAPTKRRSAHAHHSSLIGPFIVVGKPRSDGLGPR